MTPAVDIVMRTRNRFEFLPRAFADLKAQTFQDWNLIVVSGDEDPAPVVSALQAAGLEDRYTMLSAAPDSLISVMGNIGVRAGEAEFITLHDDDDTWHPDFLLRTVEHLRATGADAVGVRTEIVYEELVGSAFVETGRRLFHPRMQELTYFDLLRLNHAVPIGLLIRREAYDRIGGYDERYELVDDWVMNMSLAKDGRFDFIDEVLAFWHQRPTTTGEAGNSVHTRQRRHALYDRRVRNDALREYVAEHGDGALLYLSKYIDERTAEIRGRLDKIEKTQQEILRLLRQQVNAPTGIDKIAGKFRR